MRIAYLCREVDANLFASARQVARAGHEVYLVSESLAAARSRTLLSRGEPRWIRVERPRPDHRYFADSQSYPDRVYDTLRKLPPLDVIESCGGEALTVLRAKRLLGEFAGTSVVVRPASTPPRPTTLDEMIADFAVRYCVEHADTAPATPMAQSDLVSVLIPVYNQGQFVRQAIESLRGQAGVEIIVVDDGSTDPATIGIVDDLHGVITLRQTNRGLPAARNAGLAKASGRYILPLDADDELAPEFIGTAVKAMASNPELGYVTGNVRNFGLLEHTHVPVGHVPDLSLVVNTYGRATSLFRREAIEAVGGYDETLPAYEDWDLYLRLANAGYESDVLPVDGQYYRRHVDSMSFGAPAETRLALQQRLLEHAAEGTAERLLPLLLHFWKTQYEPSASVRLLRGHVS